MRFFLHSYAIYNNFDITVRSGVFGAKKDKTGLESKIRRLKRGDIIIIRDATQQAFQMFGYCKVVGDIFDQFAFSPYKDFIVAR